MNFKLFPVMSVIVLTLVKMSFLLPNSHILEVLGWLVAGIWFFGIAYAYFKNKNLPMIGSFMYMNGENQPGRTIATYVMLLVYVAAIFSGNFVQ